MTPSVPPGDAAPNERIPREIAQVTTQARTAALLRKGIDNLRVLSESKFMEVLETLVEETVRERLSELQQATSFQQTAPIDELTLSPLDAAAEDDTDILILDEGFNLGDELPSTGSLDPAPFEEPRSSGDDPTGAGPERREELRRKHLSALERIEGRLSQLGDTVQAMETSLGRVDTLPAGTTNLLQNHRFLAVDEDPAPSTAKERERNRRKRRALVVNTFRKPADS